MYLQYIDENLNRIIQNPNSILDNLGRKSVENIINDTTPFPDGVYRPNYNVFTTDKEEQQEKGPVLKNTKN